MTNTCIIFREFLLFSTKSSSLSIKWKTSSRFQVKATILTMHVTSDIETAKPCACWMIDDSSNRNAPVAVTKSKSMFKTKDEFRILIEWTLEIDGQMPIFRKRFCTTWNNLILLSMNPPNFNKVTVTVELIHAQLQINQNYIRLERKPFYSFGATYFESVD